MDQKGYIHTYTGNGKGKTTAAFGLAVRALSAGKRVFIGQFVKSIRYNEVKLETHYDGIVIKQYGLRCFLNQSPTPADVEAAEKGWAESLSVLQNGAYDVVVLDELTIALHYNLLKVDTVIAGLRTKCPSTEVVITGRYAPQAIIDLSDLVTEMQEVKHYYTQGVLSREGIDK